MTIITQISSVVLLTLLTLSTVISTIDKQRSYGFLLLWSVGILTFILASLIRIKFTLLSKCISLFTLICISLYALSTLHITFLPFLNHGYYQFILPAEVGGHNHLGDLVGLCLTLTFVAQTTILSRFDILLFYAVMFTSFSKSSFLALSLTYAMVFFKKRASFIYGVAIIILAVFALLIYTKEFEVYPPIKRLQNEFVAMTHLQTKPLLSSRVLYTQQAFKSWQTSDFITQSFGFGLGNFMYPSQKTATKADLGAPDAHNIFLSLFIESGLLPSLWFFIFSVFVLITGFISQSLFLYPFLYLFIHFQTDFTFHIPFFFFCFFIFAGQSISTYTDKKNKGILLILLLIALMITTFAGYMYWQTTLYKGQLLKAVDFQIKKQNKAAVFSTLYQLEQMQPYDRSQLVKSSSIYEAFGDNKNAVRLLEKILLYDPRSYLLVLPHQIELQQKMDVDIKKYLYEKRGAFSQLPFTPKEWKILNDICFQYTESLCVKK